VPAPHDFGAVGASPAETPVAGTGGVNTGAAERPAVTLETMTPAGAWDAEAHEDVLAPFRADRDRITVHVWGGDWCPDCRRQLPEFAAALSAAGVPESSIHVHAVDREKRGDLVSTYDVEYVPTVVLELDGEEVARFVETGDRPIAAELASALAARTD